MTNELASFFSDVFDRHSNSLVGFEDLFQDISDYKTSSFPPYNIYTKDVAVEDDNKKSHSEKHTFIDVATAGYKKSELKVTVDNRRNSVQITGTKLDKEEGFKYSFKGIASRNFTLKWKLQPSLEIVNCGYNDGILQLEFRYKSPESADVEEVEIN